MNSLEERVNLAYRRLVLIQAAANINPDDLGLGVEDLLASIAEAAREGIDSIEPLRHSPARISNWTPKGGAR